MLDEETYKETDAMIDCVVGNDGNIQMRLNGEIVNKLNKRLMFIDKETVDRSFAYAIFQRDMKLDQIEKFLSQFNYPKFSNKTYAFFQSLVESKENIIEHIDDVEYCKYMAENDYIYSLVYMDILQQLKDPELSDMKEYTCIYSLPKKCSEIERDLQIISVL